MLCGIRALCACIVDIVTEHHETITATGAVAVSLSLVSAATGARRWVADPPERAFAHVTADNAGSTLFVRSERQTLRRLPQTGAILFTIGIYVSPLRDISLGNVQRLAPAMRSLLDGEGERRGAGAYAHALIGYAKAREEEAGR